MEYSPVDGNLYLLNRFLFKAKGLVELSLVNKLSLQECVCVCVCVCECFKCGKCSKLGFLIFFLTWLMPEMCVCVLSVANVLSWDFFVCF